MNNIWLKGIIFFSAVLASTFFITLGISGELRPFELPSQNAPNAPAAPRERPQEKVDESVYKNFEEKTKGLSPAEKKEFIAAYGKKRDQAIANEKWDEAKHYKRLLDILGK
jgi:hypothetical protein